MNEAIKHEGGATTSSDPLYDGAVGAGKWLRAALKRVRRARRGPGFAKPTPPRPTPAPSHAGAYTISSWVPAIDDPHEAARRLARELVTGYSPGRRADRVRRLDAVAASTDLKRRTSRNGGAR